MNFRKYIIVSVLLFATLTLYSSPTFSQILPEKRPDDISFTYHEIGGMLPVSETYFISINSSFAKYFNYGASNKKYFSTNSQELDELYGVFRENDFESITTSAEMVFDRGENAVSISWGAEKLSKSNSGNSFIDEEWQEEYSTVVSAIKKLVVSKVNDMKISFTLKLDTSITNSGKVINIIIDNDFAYYSSISDMRDSINVMLLHGEHNFQLYILSSDEPPYKEKVFASKNIILDIKEGMNKITFYIEGQEIKWK